MMKVMYNEQLVYKIVIWVYVGISLWTEKVALTKTYTSKVKKRRQIWGRVDTGDCDLSDCECHSTWKINTVPPFLSLFNRIFFIIHCDLVFMYVIMLFLHLVKSIHNMFYKTTYNGITCKGETNKYFLQRTHYT